MKTKIVYVLISSPNDIYLEQAYVSMYSLKYYTPDAHIVLLTDTLTEQTFRGIRKKELKFVDEFVVIDLDGNKYTPQQRSRLLKTGVRLYVHGDFLFVDCDTIITQSLKEIDNVEAEIAACWDSHAVLHESPQYNKVVEDGGKLNWPIQNETYYYNSGVIYVKDCEITQQFYSMWQTLLKESQIAGVNMDQPSFAKTNYNMGHIIKTLDATWNCELKYGIRYLKDAKIVHYLCTNKSYNKTKQFFLLNDYDVLQQIQKDAVISDDIKTIVKDPFKGIAEVTHCFAGKDVDFFETKGFRILRLLYETSFYNLSCLMLDIVLKIWRKYRKLGLK